MPIQKKLMERSHSQCELCLSTSNLSAYSIPPAQKEDVEHSILLCDKCLGFLNNPKTQDTNHWRCLNETMWSEIPAVQVMAWRVLNSLSSEGWAQDLLGQLYLDEENLKWAQALVSEKDSSAEQVPTKDSNGNILIDGDTVTLIKDLDVKGAGFTAKRGTIVRKISLTNNPLHIEGKVNGVQIVLVAAYLKKA